MDKMISYKENPYSSIKWDNLNRQTIKESFEGFDANLFNWNNVNQIHILGIKKSFNGKESLKNEDGFFGVYYSNDKSWILIFGDQADIFTNYISKCGNNLMLIDVRFTDCIEIDVSSTRNIWKLQASDNSNLRRIIGLEHCNNLSSLNINRTPFNDLPNLFAFPKLRSLCLRGTDIDKIEISNTLKELKLVDLNNSAIIDCNFLQLMPSLEILNVSQTRILNLDSLENNTKLSSLYCSHTQIKQLPPLNHLHRLRTLNIGYTKVTSLDDVIFPDTLRSLVLEGTPIKEIPKAVTSLTNLRRLVLCEMTLDTLSADILNLNLEFRLESKGYGICLLNTYIRDVDISLFAKPRQIIESWMRSKANEKGVTGENPLNEVKVVFLGDGGAGKTLSICRLINNGERKDDFDGNATPGICINDRYYKIGDENILIHFWDFGGQEIMHSMHRMFLTKRTLYIVFVNARDNTQDERARYWLHNIKTFADGSKVILVLNQIDQNPSASVNEPALRELYPHLTTITKLSATTYEKDEFNKSLMDSLMLEVSKMSYINQPFLNSWSKLKNELQNMEQFYINADTYKSMCEECGIKEDDDVRLNLLDWFSDLGISFCYRDCSALSEYMVLRPDWITNAIYIILFNGFEKSKNGLMSHEEIHRMLKIAPEGDVTAKRVISNLSYSSIETEYVLGVIRKFKLSYRMDDEKEFIPMLCDRNENVIVKEFTDDSNVLEFRMEYSYLPNNVIHRLMVDMRYDLMHEYVWLTGAVFSSSTMGIKALVKIEDHTLRIYVISSDELYPANVYLGFLRNVIKDINYSLGITASEMIVYKKDGKKDEFEYDYLNKSYKHGNRETFSRVFNKNISILDILNQSEGDIIERENKTVDDVIDSCLSMQGNKLFWDKSENERNTLIRDLLRHSGYIIADQTLSGESESGKNAGELDFVIMESANKPVAIFEALNLRSFSNTSKAYWDKHLQKLLDNYNPTGLPFSFLVSYVNCSKDNFKEFWLKYLEYINMNNNSKYSIQKVQEKQIKQFYLRAAKCIYDRAGIPTTVYHIIVRLGD